MNHAIDVIWRREGCVKAACARGRESVPGWKCSLPLPGACSLGCLTSVEQLEMGQRGTGETLKESAKPSSRDLEHVLEREEHGGERFLMDMRGARSWACLLGLLVGGICVLQTAVYSLAGRRRAGSWAAWKRPPGSSRGKSAFEKTMNTSVGLLSLGPGGWCLRPTASTSEPCIPWCRPPSHSGSAAFPGVLRAALELFYSFPSFSFVVESECVLVIYFLNHGKIHIT